MKADLSDGKRPHKEVSPLMQTEDKGVGLAQPQMGLRHDLQSDQLISAEATGGEFSRKTALRLQDLMTQLLVTDSQERKIELFRKAEEETLAATVSKLEHRNWYKILCGFSLVSALPEIFNLCREKINKSPFGSYNETLLRTDSKIRKMLSFSLQAAIITGDVFLAKKLLVFARSNTFLLHLNHYWMQVVLRVSEPDGPGGTDDFSLLKALLKHETVYKGHAKQSLDHERKTQNPYQRDKSRQANAIKFLRQAANLDLRNVTNGNFFNSNRANYSIESARQSQMMSQRPKKSFPIPKKELSDRVNSGDKEGEIEHSAIQDITDIQFLRKTSREDEIETEQSIQQDNRSKDAKIDFLLGEQYKEKYLRFQDVIELLLLNHRQGEASLDFIGKVFISLIVDANELNREKAVAVICDFDQTDKILSKVDRMDDDKDLRDDIVVIIYIEALNRQWMHVAMRLMKTFENVILKQQKRVLPPLLQSLTDSPFQMDSKLSMIKPFLPKIQFQYVDILITKMQKIVEDSRSEKGMLITNINPFLIVVTILEIFYRIKKAFPLSSLRIQVLEESLKENLVQLLSNVYDPYKVRLMLKQKDLDNYSALDLMARLDLHSVMQTNVADRVIQDTWMSQVDVSGSWLELSTMYEFLWFRSVSDEEDFEVKRRFYHSRDLEVDVRPHKLTYRFWFESMYFRYFIEMAFFAINVLVFQYYISQFNTDIHLIDTDLKELVDLGVFETDSEGRILASTTQEVTINHGYASERELQEHIQDVREHLAHEIDLAVFELDEAMVVAMISFAFPFQVMMSYLYAQKTNRNFTFRTANFFDLTIFVCVAIWFEKYEEYIQADNDGFGLSDPPSEYHRFMYRLLNDINTGEFHFDWLLAFTAFLFWYRIIMMLQLTTIFGPLIKTIFSMLKDLIVFLLLFSIQLVSFSCVAILAFGKLPEFYTLHGALVTLLGSSLGEFDFSIYEGLSDPDDETTANKKYVGIGFHIVFLCVNLLLMLNLIIALMADTYSHLAQVSRGLYSHGIVEAIPSYKNDKRYGGLICLIPPLNMFAWLLYPCYASIKDKGRLQRFNQRVCKVIYFPFGLIFTIIFFVVDLVLVPFAYFKVVAHKFKQVSFKKSSCCAFPIAVTYVVLGMPLMLITTVVDSVWFFRYLYQWNMPKVQIESKYPTISLRAFNKFNEIVNERQGLTCNAKKLIMQVRTQFQTTECIFGVLYANKFHSIEGRIETDKSARNAHRLVGEIGNKKNAEIKIDEAKIFEGIDYNLRGINTYTLFKRIIWSCVTDRPNGDDLDDMSEVNLPLLKGLLNEIFSEIYVANMMSEARESGEKDFKKIDINDTTDFADYSKTKESLSLEIGEQLKQVVLIDPNTIMEAFGVRNKPLLPDSSATGQSGSQEKQSSTNASSLNTKGSQDIFKIENSQETPNASTAQLKLLQDIKTLLLQSQQQQATTLLGLDKKFEETKRL